MCISYAMVNVRTGVACVGCKHLSPASSNLAECCCARLHCHVAHIDSYLCTAEAVACLFICTRSGVNKLYVHMLTVT